MLDERQDTVLREKYTQFQTMWRDVIPKIKDKHSAMFNIAFMCQRNLDPEAYFEKLINPEELTVMDIVLINSDTNEGIFLLGTIQTLLKWQQELLNKARKCLKRPMCKSRNAQDCSKEDLVT